MRIMKRKPACLTDHAMIRKFCLSFGVSRDRKLWISNRQHATILTEPEMQEISLRDLLARFSLTICAKRVIGLILCRALLHLLGGKWAVSEALMTLDRISLYYTMVEDKVHVFFDKVLLSTEFLTHTHGSVCSDDSDDIRDSPLQSLVSLAITLSKIELGGLFLHLEQSREYSLLASNPLGMANFLLQECRQRSAMPPLAIQFCLDLCSRPHSQFHHLSSDQLLANTEFINMYYTNIIRPLEGWLIKNKWSWNQVNWQDSVDACVMRPNGMCYMINRSPEASHQATSAPVLRGSRPPAVPIAPNGGMDMDSGMMLYATGMPAGCVMDYKTLPSPIPPERG